MFGGAPQKRAKSNRSATPKSPTKVRKLHSIGGLLKGRDIVGSFEVAGIKHEFAYHPASTAIVGKRLQLTGELRIGQGGTKTEKPHSRSGVKTTLVGIQGGIGTAPQRKKMPADFYTARPGLPSVDSSGSSSFVGVLYLHFEPLDGNAFGVKADLSRLQLNARLWPIDDMERAIQAAFSEAADVVLSKNFDRSMADEAAIKLNLVLNSLVS